MINKYNLLFNYFYFQRLFCNQIFSISNISAKEANEKPQGLVEEIPLSDNITANLARNVSPITAETDVTQNIPSEILHVTGMFYSYFILNIGS
jgi:hypothetical protein